jgi:hypothetical protein
MYRRLVGRMAAMLAIAFLSSAGAAQASIVVDLVSVVPSGGGFTWTYEAFLGPGQLVQTGAPPGPGPTTPGSGSPGGAVADYFTIYDFAGFTGVTSAPAGWTPLNQLLGPTPADFVLLLDDSVLFNLTWYRDTGFVVAQGSMGFFSAESTFNVAVIEDVSAEDTSSSTGLSIVNTDTVQVASASVPEPATLLLMGSGFLGLSLYRRRRT